MFTFANPFGLLALLGLPAVFAIHFLQRKSIELPIATLFLLERTPRDSQSGRRFDRLIPSIPLWMQLLAVLILTWILAEPRYQKSGSVQRIAVVMDSSASMSVFKNEAIRRLTAALPQLQGPATTLELTILESIASRPRLYAGSSISDCLKTLEKWQPLDGLNDPSQSLRLARSLVSNEGSVIFVTDTPQEPLPFSAKLLAVGKVIDNVGFTGVTFSQEQDTLVWRTIVRNYGKTAVERSWSLQTATGSSPPQTLRLAANAIVTLQAAFPLEAKNVQLVLSADQFTLDDRLPLIAPKPKALKIFSDQKSIPKALTNKLLHALENTIEITSATDADLSFVTHDPRDSALPSGPLVVFVADDSRKGAYLKGGIVSEAHPLMDNLNWQSLIVRESTALSVQPSDRVLLWQDKRPLIFLRKSKSSEQLCFNFDLSLSNAANQPAFIILMHRFAESIRKLKVAPVACNLETGQALEIAGNPDSPTEIAATGLDGKSLDVAAGSSVAPKSPCFLTVSQKNVICLEAAVQFADTREANFSNCATSPEESFANPATLERLTRADPWWRLWLILLITILLISWKFTGTTNDLSHS